MTVAVAPPTEAGSDRVIVVLPAVTPVTVKLPVTVPPAAMVRLAGATVATRVLEDCAVTVRPPAGAGWLSCATKVALPPGATTRLAGTGVSV